VLSGWSSSLGFSTASEAQEALTFYNQVVARVGGPDNVILTGHSLGGGLAGFVADLNGVQADVFDNIPFGAAVYAETDDSSYTLPLSSHYVTQFVTLGEVATGLRSAEFEVASPVIGPVGALYGLYLDNALNSGSETLSSYAGLASPTNLHSQALMVLLLDAQIDSYTAWQSIGPSLYNAMYNGAIATAVGITQTGWYSPAAATLSEIAYSTLVDAGGGPSPFGTTAATSLFNDADELGKLVNSGQLTGLLAGNSVQNALVEIAMQYAADQAATAGANNGQDGSSANAKGTFAASTDSVLNINLDPKNFVQTYSAGTSNIVGVSDLATALWGHLVQNESFLNVMSFDSLGQLIQSDFNQLTSGATEMLAALTSGAALDGTNAQAGYNGATGGAILFGADGSGNITGGNGNDLIIGGATVNTGNGNDLILAETGTETVDPGTGSDLIVGGKYYANSSGNTTVDYSGANGSGGASAAVQTISIGNSVPNGGFAQEGIVNVQTVSGNGQAGGTDTLAGVSAITLAASATENAANVTTTTINRQAANLGSNLAVNLGDTPATINVGGGSGTESGEVELNFTKPTSGSAVNNVITVGTGQNDQQIANDTLLFVNGKQMIGGALFSVNYKDYFNQNPAKYPYGNVLSSSQYNAAYAAYTKMLVAENPGFLGYLSVLSGKIAFQSNFSVSLGGYWYRKTFGTQGEIYSTSTDSANSSWTDLTITLRSTVTETITIKNWQPGEFGITLVNNYNYLDSGANSDGILQQPSQVSLTQIQSQLKTLNIVSPTSTPPGIKASPMMSAMAFNAANAATTTSSNTGLLDGSEPIYLNAGAGNVTLTGQAGGDYLVAGSGNDVLLGRAGDETLVGGSGAALLDGGTGSNTLIAGTGADTFRFDGSFSADDVQGFNVASDKLEFAFAVFANYAAFAASANEVNGNLVVTGANGGVITIKGVTLSQLQPQNFIFDAPAALQVEAVTATTNKNAPVAGALSVQDVIANDTPTFQLVSGPQDGVATINANGTSHGAFAVKCLVLRSSVVLSS
jgi:hypothetical protein